MGVSLFFCLTTAVGFSSFMSETPSRCPRQSPPQAPVIPSRLGLRGGEDGGVLADAATNGNRQRLRPHVDQSGVVHHVLEEALGPSEPRGQDEPGPALIMVNYKLDKELLKTVWNKATVKICADGALNRLYNTFDDDEERQQYIPDFVRGFVPRSSLGLFLRCLAALERTA